MSTNLLTMLTQDLHEMRSCVWYPSFNKWCFGAFRCWIYWKMLASPCLIISLQTMQAFLGDLDVNLYSQTSFFRTQQRLLHPCRTGVFGWYSCTYVLVWFVYTTTTILGHVISDTKTCSSSFFSTKIIRNNQNDQQSMLMPIWNVLPLSQIICRFWFPCRKFNSICRKYVQYFVSPNKFIKKLYLKIFPIIPIMYHKY